MGMRTMLMVGIVAQATLLGGCEPSEVEAKPPIEPKLAEPRPALDGYRPVVTDDNVTTLGVARTPFATYLTAIHNRIHPIFAGEQLEILSRLPKDDRLNDMTLSTDLELVLDKDTGRIVQMGVLRSSGVAAYDGAVLAAMKRAAPFGTAPDIIASPDGNVYVHWEFHRDPVDACTTRNARAYLLARALSPLRTEMGKSRPVGLLAGPAGACPFPHEADVDGIDMAVVGLRVIVRPDGTARDAELVSDPGHGFGPAARACALAWRYAPARDRNGTPVEGAGSVNLRFSR